MKSDEWEKIKEIFNAVLDLPETEHAAFLANCDKDLRLKVEKLLNSDEKAEDFIVEPAFVEVGFSKEDEQDFYVGKQIDAYKILEEIGHGGMGTVYLAVKADETFDKKVAIKLIKRGMDTNAVLRRFVMERQILASLENPNIATLIDGGSTADGLPYLVMEYIEGEPITRFCDSHQFNIEDRLELFRKVCSAVSYAHQNLVVHRDLKPSNILVTTDVIPKLLDFGIAKLLNPDWSLETTEATATMFRLMTPEYASPEQIRGLPITTTSDVYSLGVVLYELLSGERPYKIESRLPEEIAQIILTEEPIKPSAVTNSKFQISNSGSEAETLSNDERRKTDGEQKRKSQIVNLKSLKGDLDNIILKALGKEPKRRYQSVQEFSEDIRRHLAGLPVTATADTTFYRIRKFIKRHRLGVLGGVLILLTILLATTITTWEAIVANRQQAKTQQRFNQVRKLANTILFEYHEDVAKLPGSTALREKMVKDALEYLDNLSAEGIEDKELQLELAAAYEKVGDVQGNPYSANLGNQDGALDSYKKSLAIREVLFANNPNNIQTRAGLTKSYEKLGDILWAKGESVDSQANYRKALAICEELSSEGNLSDAKSFVRLYNRIGEAQEQTGDLMSGLESYQNQLKAGGNLVAVEPANADYQTSVLSAYGKIGDIYFQLDNFKKASENYQQSLQMLQKLFMSDPINSTLQRKRALVLARLAMTKMNTGELPEAVEYNRQAIQILKEIYTADPNNVQIKYNLADIQGNLGEAFGKMRDLPASEENFRQSISQFKELLVENPNYAQVRSHFANSYSDYAGILLKNGKAAGALENYRQALATLETQGAKGMPSESFAQIYEGIGDALVLLNKKPDSLKEAKEMYQKSLNIWQELQQGGKLNTKNIEKLNEMPEKIEKCETVLAKLRR